MDELTAAALVGTARQPTPTPRAGLPTDTLLTEHAATAERTLLLAAGGAALYRQAGRLPDPPTAAPAPPEAETLGAPTPGIATLLAELFGSQHHQELLPEALDRLRQNNMHLQPSLLSLALDSKDSAIRSALVPVLGTRGRWLAALNPAWRWAAKAVDTVGDVLPADTEALWTEGTPPQRQAVLALIRRTRPAQARTWLESVWKAEKAEMRAALLESLTISLLLDDEPFLEAALDDRAEKVRARAGNLLATLPGSAYASRMRERAGMLLDYLPADRPEQTWALRLNLPHSIDAAWQRDANVARLPEGVSRAERAWYAAELIARIPPVFWTARFQTTPTELIAAADGEEWALLLLECLSRAAILHQDMSWMGPLWLWTQRAWNQDNYGALHSALIDDLTRHAPAGEREHYLGELLARVLTSFDHPGWVRLQSNLLTLPVPWGERFSRGYLRILYDVLRDPSSNAESLWWAALAVAATRAAPDHLHHTRQLVERARTDDVNPGIAHAAQSLYVQGLIRQIVDAVQLRGRLYGR